MNQFDELNCFAAHKTLRKYEDKETVELLKSYLNHLEDLEREYNLDHKDL